MPAKSEAQKKLFTWVLACKRGEAKDCPKGIEALAKSMTEEQLEDFIGVKHEELPEEVKEAIELASIQMLNNLNEGLNPDDYKGGNPGIESTDKYPTFTPTVFKLPMKKAKKIERRIYDFDQFLKIINYKTHSGETQNGHGQNLTGKASKEGAGIASIS